MKRVLTHTPQHSSFQFFLVIIARIRIAYAERIQKEAEKWTTNKEYICAETVADTVNDDHEQERHRQRSIV